MALSKTQRDILNIGVEAASKNARANKRAVSMITEDVRIKSFYSNSRVNETAGVVVILSANSTWTSNFNDIVEFVKSLSPKGEVEVNKNGDPGPWVQFTI